MKKKISKRKRERNSFKLVPKDYGGYVFLYVILSVLMIPGTVVILVALIQRWSEFEVSEVLIVLILPVFSTMAIMYMILSIVRISSGKIYLEISQGALRFSGVLVKRSMKVSDIKSIRKLRGVRHLTSLIIRREDNKYIRGSKKIKFPLIWFSERDVENFLRYLGGVNGKIEWRDF